MSECAFCDGPSGGGDLCDEHDTERNRVKLLVDEAEDAIADFHDGIREIASAHRPVPPRPRDVVGPGGVDTDDLDLTDEEEAEIEELRRRATVLRFKIEGLKEEYDL